MDKRLLFDQILVALALTMGYGLLYYSADISEEGTFALMVIALMFVVNGFMIWGTSRDERHKLILNISDVRNAWVPLVSSILPLPYFMGWLESLALACYLVFTTIVLWALYLAPSKYQRLEYTFETNSPKEEK